MWSVQGNPTLHTSCTRLPAVQAMPPAGRPTGRRTQTNDRRAMHCIPRRGSVSWHATPGSQHH